MKVRLYKLGMSSCVSLCVRLALIALMYGNGFSDPVEILYFLVTFKSP